MSDGEDSPEERMLHGMSKVMAAHSPDVLVFELKSAEVRDILLDQARVAEKMAIDERERRRSAPRPARRRIAPQGLPPPPPASLTGMSPMPPVPMFACGDEHYEPPSLEEQYLRLGRHYRFLASHVPERRVFRLGVHDLGFLGIPQGLAHPSLENLAAAQAVSTGSQEENEP